MAERNVLEIILQMVGVNRAVADVNKLSASVLGVGRAQKIASESSGSLALKGTMFLGAAGALAGGLYGLISPAMEAEAALAHVSTAMNDGAQQAQHLAEVQKFTEATSARTVFSNEALASSYYIARSANIGHAAALQAVQAATALTTATTKDAAAAQAALEPTTRTLTTLYQNFGGSLSGYADELSKLQTAYSFRDIGEVTAALSYAAPVAKNAGISVAQMGTALALISQSGKYSAEAGTQFEEFVSKLTSDKKLQGFIVRTAQGGIDLQQTLLRLRQTFGSMPKAQLGLYLAQFGFTERSAGGIAELLDKLNEWQSIQKDLQNSSGEAARLAAVRMAATDEQLAMVSNNFKLLRESLGAALLPAIQAIVPPLVSALQAATSFAREHSTFTKYALTFTALAAGALALGGALLLASSAARGFQVFSKLWEFVSTIRLIENATKLWTAAQWLLDAALAANPIALAIIGAAVLAAAAYLIVRNWTAVSAFFRTWASAIVGYIMAPFHAIGSAISGAIGVVKSGALDVAHAVARFWVHGSPTPPEGPLHELNLGAMLANTMAPSHVMSAARRAAAAVALSMPLLMTPAAGMAATTSTVTSPVVVNLNYSVQVEGGASAQDWEKQTRAHAHELVRIINSELSKRERTKF